MAGPRRSALMAGGPSPWVGRRVRTSDGDSLGIAVGVDAHSVFRHPTWLLVDTGMPDTPVVIAPTRGSSLLGDDIVIGADRDAVLTAPAVDGLSVMDPADEQSLTAHFATRANSEIPPDEPLAGGGSRRPVTHPPTTT